MIITVQRNPSFIIRGYRGNDPLKDLGLTKTIHTTNMWLMTPQGMKKYSSPEEILVDYAQVRVKHYTERKKNLLREYKFLADVASNKARFVQLVADDQITVFRRKRDNVEQQITEFKLRKVKDSYDYLFNIRTEQYTEENIAKLNKEANDKLKTCKILEKMSIPEMWKIDLNI